MEDYKVNQKEVNNTEKKVYLKAEIIYSYLLGINEKLETAIMCNGNNFNFVTSDQSLYEALGSIQDKKQITSAKLVKFLEVVDIISFKNFMNKERKILTDQRVNEIKKHASVSKDVDFVQKWR